MAGILSGFWVNIDAPLDQPLFAILEFRLQQRFEITEKACTVRARLLGELPALRGDAWQAQHLGGWWRLLAPCRVVARCQDARSMEGGPIYSIEVRPFQSIEITTKS
jgi:hypothetical protein